MLKQIFLNSEPEIKYSKLEYQFPATLGNIQTKE